MGIRILNHLITDIYLLCLVFEWFEYQATAALVFSWWQLACVSALTEITKLIRIRLLGKSGIQMVYGLIELDP